MDIFFGVFILFCLAGAFMILLAIAGAILAVLDK